MGTKRGQIQIACLLGSLILFSGLALVLKGPAPTSTEPALAKTAPDARASAGQRLGKAMWGPAEVNGVSQFPTYKDLGVGIYQMAIDWSQIAATRPATATDPADPAYQWPEHFEKTILEANRYGMQVTMMVIGAPAWANGA